VFDEIDHARKYDKNHKYRRVIKHIFLGKIPMQDHAGSPPISGGATLRGRCE